MTRQPPLLPSEALRRVLRVARFDGLGVLAFAGAFAVLSAGAQDISGTVIGLLVAGAGAIGLHGVTLLHRGEPKGLNWLVGSQLYLLATLLGYCAWRLTHLDPFTLDAMRLAITDEQRLKLQEINWTEERFLHAVYRLIYFVIAAVTCIYQPLMCLYYLRRRGAVETALAEIEPEA